MTVKYAVAAYNKSDEFLAFKIEIPEDKLGYLKNIMNWDDDEFESFLDAGWVYDLTIEQVKLMENVLGKQFYSDLYDFQIGGWKYQ